MSLIYEFLDFIIHLNIHISSLINSFGPWAYLILFLIIFCETGLVIAPFLPGDSLLFAAGAVTALPTVALNVHILAGALILAAVMGDTCNYWIGRLFGEKLFSEHSRLLNRKYIDITHAYFEKYGGKTIFIARFVPIVRTMTPFVAGLGAMTFKRFITYSLLAAIVWVTLIMYTGYFFGNIPFVKHNFVLIVAVIIAISVAPGCLEFLRQHGKRRRRKHHEPNSRIK